MAKLGTYFGNKKLPEETVNSYWEILGDLPFKYAMMAVIKVMAEWEYQNIPLPAVIRKATIALQNPNTLTPAEAWSQANAALDKYGYYGAVEGMKSLSPAIRKTIRALGGFESVCATDNIETVRAQFMRMYDSFAKTEREYEVLPESVKQFIAGAQVKQIAG